MRRAVRIAAGDRRASKDARNPTSGAGPMTCRTPASVMRHPVRTKRANPRLLRIGKTPCKPTMRRAGTTNPSRSVRNAMNKKANVGPPTPGPLTASVRRVMTTCVATAPRGLSDRTLVTNASRGAVVSRVVVSRAAAVPRETLASNLERAIELAKRSLVFRRAA